MKSKKKAEKLYCFVLRVYCLQKVDTKFFFLTLQTSVLTRGAHCPDGSTVAAFASVRVAVAARIEVEAPRIERVARAE